MWSRFEDFQRIYHNKHVHFCRVTPSNEHDRNPTPRKQLKCWVDVETIWPDKCGAHVGVKCWTVWLGQRLGNDKDNENDVYSERDKWDKQELNSYRGIWYNKLDEILLVINKWHDIKCKENSGKKSESQMGFKPTAIYQYTHFGGWLVASWYALVWQHNAVSEFMFASHKVK